MHAWPADRRARIGLRQPSALLVNPAAWVSVRSWRASLSLSVSVVMRAMRYMPNH